jgi:hypothetical protein
MHSDLKRLKLAISRQIKYIADTIKKNPSGLHRNATITLGRLLKTYLELRKLYAGDSKEVKITVELVGLDEPKSDTETLEGA